MSKYTDLQLKVMAQEILHMRSIGDVRVFQFVQILCAIARIGPVDIMNRINYYANRECS